MKHTETKMSQTAAKMSRTSSDSATDNAIETMLAFNFDLPISKSVVLFDEFPDKSETFKSLVLCKTECLEEDPNKVIGVHKEDKQIENAVFNCEAKKKYCTTKPLKLHRRVVIYEKFNEKKSQRGRKNNNVRSANQKSSKMKRSKLKHRNNLIILGSKKPENSNDCCASVKQPQFKTSVHKNAQPKDDKINKTNKEMIQTSDDDEFNSKKLILQSELNLSDVEFDDYYIKQENSDQENEVIEDGNITIVKYHQNGSDENTITLNYLKPIGDVNLIKEKPMNDPFSNSQPKNALINKINEKTVQTFENVEINIKNIVLPSKHGLFNQDKSNKDNKEYTTSKESYFKIVINHQNRGDKNTSNFLEPCTDVTQIEESYFNIEDDSPRQEIVKKNSILVVTPDPIKYFKTSNNCSSETNYINDNKNIRDENVHSKVSNESKKTLKFPRTKYTAHRLVKKFPGKMDAIQKQVKKLKTNQLQSLPKIDDYFPNTEQSIPVAPSTRNADESKEKQMTNSVVPNISKEQQTQKPAATLMTADQSVHMESQVSKLVVEQLRLVAQKVIHVASAYQNYYENRCNGSFYAKFMNNNFVSVYLIVSEIMLPYKNDFNFFSYFINLMKEIASEKGILISSENLKICYFDLLSWTENIKSSFKIGKDANSEFCKDSSYPILTSFLSEPTKSFNIDQEPNNIQNYLTKENKKQAPQPVQKVAGAPGKEISISFDPKLTKQRNQKATSVDHPILSSEKNIYYAPVTKQFDNLTPSLSSVTPANNNSYNTTSLPVYQSTVQNSAIFNDISFNNTYKQFVNDTQREAAEKESRRKRGQLDAASSTYVQNQNPSQPGQYSRPYPPPPYHQTQNHININNFQHHTRVIDSSYRCNQEEITVPQNYKHNDMLAQQQLYERQQRSFQYHQQHQRFPQHQQHQSCPQYQQNQQFYYHQQQLSSYATTRRIPTQERSSVSRDSGFMSPASDAANGFDIPITHMEPRGSSISEGGLTPLIVQVTSINPNATYAPPSKCTVCNKMTNLKCLACSLSYYCSYECQASDWSLHKMFCTKSVNNQHV